MSVSKHINGISVEANEEMAIEHINVSSNETIDDGLYDVDFDVETSTNSKLKIYLCNINSKKLPRFKIDELKNKILLWKSYDGVFMDAFKDSDVSYDTTELYNLKMDINIILNNSEDNDVRKKLIALKKKGFLHITFKHFIMLYLTVNNKNKHGNYSEYMKIHRVLLDRPNSLNILKGYIDVTLSSPYKPYYELLEPRTESLITEWIANMISSDSHVKHYKDMIVYDYQTEIDRKLFDMCLLIDKNNDCKNIKKYLNYNHRIIIEIQEDSVNHTNNPNDSLKNIIARNNNCVIFYFSKKDYEKHKTNYLNDFWNTLKFTLLGALLQDINNVPKYLQICHKDFLKSERDSANELLKNSSYNSDDLRNEIDYYKLQLSNNSEKVLLEFFEYKKKAVDSAKTVKLNEKLNEETKLIKNIPLDNILYKFRLNMETDEFNKLKKKLVKEYPSQFIEKNKQLFINWRFMYMIISLYAEEQIKKNLISYLISVDAIFPMIHNIIQSYLLNQIKEMKIRNNLDKLHLETKYQEIIDEKNTYIDALEVKVKGRDRVIDELVSATEIYIEICETYKESWDKYRKNIKDKTIDGIKYKITNPLLNPLGKKITTSDIKVKKELDEKLKNANNEIKIADNKDLPAKDYELICDMIDGEQILENIPNFPIVYSSNELQQIKYEGLYEICVYHNIKHTIQKKIIDKFSPLSNGYTGIIPNLRILDTDQNFQKYNIIARPLVPPDSDDEDNNISEDINEEDIDENTFEID